MATPASFAAPYASDVISTFDIDKPEVYAKLIRARGNQGLTYFELTKALGFVTPVAQTTYSHYEEDWIHEVFHNLNNESAPGAGNPITITLSPSDLDASNRFYPRKNDVVMFPNEVTGVITIVDVTTPTAPILTIYPQDATDDIGAVSAGTELIIFSGQFSEGSGQPDGAFTGTFKYENDTQIIKEKMTATGTEMTNQKWFTQMSDGKGIQSYYLKGQMDTDYRMALKMDGALLFSKRTTTSIIDPETNRALKSTEGLVPYIDRVGHTKNYTAGSFSVSKFDEAVKVLDKEFAPSYICALNGIDLDIDIENALVDYFSSSDVVYAKKAAADTMFGRNADMEAAVGFKYLVKGGRTFAFKRMQSFSHPKVYGASGYDISGLGVLLPMTKKKDKMTMNELPTFGSRYKQLGKYNRMMEVWNISGAGPFQKVIEQDLHNYNMRCDIGFHGMAGNQMILWRKA